MIRGSIIIALGIFAGVASALIARGLGLTGTFGKTAVFVIVFVVVFGGGSLWLRKAPRISSPG